MQNKEPLISVIVPVYNVEQYLNKCISSIVNQTYKNLEIILMDDGSNDNSPQICDNWKEKDSRIIVIHQKNKGVSEARNNGINIANGEYIGFVDSDDYIEDNMYEILYENMEKTNSDISMCSYNIVSDNNIRYHYHKIKDNLLIIDNKNLFFELLNKNYYKGFSCNKLFKAKILKEIKFDTDIHVCEDLLLVTKIALRSNRFCFDNNRLYNYCIRSDSAYNSKLSIKTLSAIKAYENIIKLLKDKKISCVDEYIVSEFNWVNRIVNEYNFKNTSEKNILKNKEKFLYVEIKKSKNIKIKTKLETFIRFKLYGVFNFILNIYHFVKKMK